MVLVAVAVAALGAIFLANRGGSSGTGKPGQYKFQVGQPGPGQKAPPIRLPSTEGNTFDLSAQKGRTVLLYFQEGLSCQPCWDQLKAIQSDGAKFQALGIDQIVSITTDPLAALRQKASDEGLKVPVLTDPHLAVSQEYNANHYGMMGDSRDGHSFVLVGPDGTIRWRADYGGAPDYTMYVPDSNLLADIRAGTTGAN